MTDKKYTIYATYNLSSDDNIKNFGYSNPIHCNYIQKLTTDSIVSDIRLAFSSPDDFKFLNSITTGWTGFTASKFYVIIQIVDNETFTDPLDIKPDSTKWRVYDLTTQISNYVADALLNKDDITSTIFKINVNQYYSMPLYVLDSDLNYIDINTPNLNFGDETFFYGNVATDIEAVAYNTDLAITLPKDQFNATTNLTWDTIKPIYITEVGLYSEDENGIKTLVAIGKLNNPLKKDSTIGRTILFGLDF